MERLNQEDSPTPQKDAYDGLVKDFSPMCQFFFNYSKLNFIHLLEKTVL
jgi:hypothetical protein